MNNEPQKIPENEAMDTGDVKKTKSDDDKPATSNKPTSNISPLNFPIAKAKGQAAIVKLYNVEDGTFKVNDMVEFIGIVSLSPLLANTHSDMDDNDILAQFSKQEIVAKNPPASLIPRLHVVKYTKLCHNNPQLPRELTGNNVAWEELRRLLYICFVIILQPILSYFTTSQVPNFHRNFENKAYEKISTPSYMIRL